MWGVKVRGWSDFKGFACRGVISRKGNNCGRSRVGWVEMELQIWPGLWPNRESLLFGPRQPARYQQLSPEAGLCQETSLLVVGRQIVGTEVPLSSLISLNPQFSLFLVQAIMISCMGNSLLTLVTLTFIPLIKRLQWDLLGGTVDESPPANAGDMGLIPVPARFHNATEQLSRCTATTEAVCCNNWSPHLEPVFCSEKPPQREACAPPQRAAPAHRNWRKPAQGDEDPVQPKINRNTKEHVFFF